MTERPARYDVKELCGRVSLAELIGRAVVLKKSGAEFLGLCPFHDERTPSFWVNDQKGQYYCFGCRAKGDAVAFLMNHEKLGFREAAEKLLAIAGGDSVHITASRPKLRPARMREDEAARKASAIRWAEEKWKEAFPAGCTPVEAYLMGRGIDPALLGGVPPTLKYHRNLWHAETSKEYPAMVGLIQDARGVICGLHRTFLATTATANNPAATAAVRSISGATPRDLVIKAPIPHAKKMMGIAKGGVVRLAAAGPVLAIAEGIETALSVMQSTGLPAWAALSLGNLAELTLPPEVSEVRLFADGDNKDMDAAEAELLRAVAAYASQGVRVSIARPPPGMDFNDVLLKPYVLGSHTEAKRTRLERPAA